MVLIRPVSLDDLDQLLQLASVAGVGLTTLPKDRDLLRRRIEKSQRSMAAIPDRPGGESYLFVMQDIASGNVIGACGIVSKVGGFEPFYAYRLENERLQSRLLDLDKEISVLHLVREHDGPAEVGSLFLSPDYRKKDYGRFLQLVRFLFLAEHPEAFESTVVSELRGVVDAQDGSPFWNAIGRHFFNIDFPRADYLSVVNKKFIADLMPTYPIYVTLLPEAAQKVIGKVHESSEPAMKNLQAEGFTFSGMIDIFDGGPCVSCERDAIRTVKQSRVATVERIVDQSIESPGYMIGTRGQHFRACIGSMQVMAPGRIHLMLPCASALDVRAGDQVRYALLRPASATGGT